MWETFAGEAEISKAALRRNLQVMQPIDSLFDSTVEKHRTKEIHDCLRRGGGIKFVVCAFPCTLWSILNYNCNYAHRRDELAALQEKIRWQIDFAVSIAKIQLQAGHYFLLEN